MYMNRLKNKEVFIRAGGMVMNASNSNVINNSRIFEHFEQTDHPIRVEDFKIITSCPIEDLYILESIYLCYSQTVKSVISWSA